MISFVAITAGRHLNLGENVSGGDGLHRAAGTLFRRFAESLRAM